MTQVYRITALFNYTNGALAWPDEYAAHWLEGEERILPQWVYERLMADIPSAFEVKRYTVPAAEEIEPAPQGDEIPKNKGGRPRKAVTE